ncbi:prepilin-type N-terminal cleavage/methylation domain-containing protein [Acinetobacter sp. BIGb0102]|uniref:pilus assembly FimT family protein n=1 Tax=Acinetobacter sp. BIGb0102 TaxID=2485131 RepID=UPI000F4E73C3|nr:prepilin-type N-terminal cleavage/methylation domain-containing protein [Acinetobacter sp. BIGb0102]RPE29896.1 prepilin-type N-terminal cleavage/methylation domain-containing protein [Acinetobacter sp. BIGb0102]
MGKTRGFTLIELMVTIAVLAVIAMMAAPSFGNLIARKQLDTTAKDFALVFGETRGQAISLGKDITLKLTCPIETNTANGQTEVICPVNNSTTLYWVSPKDEIVLTSDAVDVVFSGLGIAQSRTNGEMINNPNYDPDKVSTKQDGTTIVGDTLSLLEPDKSLNPSKIPKTIPLEFTLCNTQLGESRTILVSKNGTVDGIYSGTCQ